VDAGKRLYVRFFSKLVVLHTHHLTIIIIIEKYGIFSILNSGCTLQPLKLQHEAAQHVPWSAT